MNGGVELGLGLSLVSAVALNWGFLVQQRAAAGLPRLRLRRPLASLGTLLRCRRWVLGSAAGLAGWGLYIAALALAPLSLVQTASAGGIGVLGVLVHFGPGPDRLRRGEWAGVGLAVAGLVALVATVPGTAAGRPAGAAALAAWLAGSALAALLAAGPGARRLAGGAGFGLAAGLLYGAGDVATKAVVSGRPLLVLVVVAASCGAFTCLQLGFQRGGPLATAGSASVLTNVLPIAAGVAVFGESLPPGAAGVARCAAFALVTAGAAALVRAQTGAGSASPGIAASSRGIRRNGAGMKRSSASAPAAAARQTADASGQSA